MNRLIVFLAVLLGFVLAFTMFSYKSLKISNEKFNLKQTEDQFHAKQVLIETLSRPKEKSEEAEVEVKEYAPIVELSTPQLVSGNKLFGQCISCHGKGGEGKASQKAPFIGGQYDWYIEKQLNDMKAGVRNNPPMATILKGLSPEDIKDLAAYISKLPWKKLVESAEASAKVEK